jgi:hypothetical protein
MILEAICSGIPTENALHKLAQALEVDAKYLQALQVRPDDPKPLDKIVEVFNLYTEKLTVRRSVRVYGITSMKRKAVEAAIESIALTERFQLTLILLFGIASGTSVDGLARNFLKDEAGRKRPPNSREKIAISEMFRHLLQPPPRFQKHDSVL